MLQCAIDVPEHFEGDGNGNATHNSEFGLRFAASSLRNVKEHNGGELQVYEEDEVFLLLKMQSPSASLK